MTMLPPDPIYIFKGEMESVSCIAFKLTSTDECLYAGTIAGVVHIWDLKSKRETKAVKVSENSCISIYPSEDGVVVSHDKSGCVSFWKESKDPWLLLTQIKTDFFGFCKFFIFENNIYAPVKDSKFEVISKKTYEPVESLSFTTNSKLGEVMSFKVFAMSNRKLMIVAHEGCRLVLWDVEKSEKLSEMEMENCPMAVDFEPRTSKGICGDPSETMLVFSVNGKLEMKEERRVKLPSAGVASVRIRDDSRVVGVGCWDGRLRLYSWKTLVLLAVLDVHSGTVQDVSFVRGRDNKFLLAAGSQDCRISLWDLYNSHN